MLDLEPPGDESPDGQLLVREDIWLEKLGDAIGVDDRPRFLREIYSWEEESKSATDSAIELNATNPGYYNQFLASQERILAFIRRYVDENYFFNDTGISESFKSLVNGPLTEKNRDLAARIRAKLNFSISSGRAAVKKAIKHLEVVASEYVNETDQESSKLQEHLMDDILAFLDVAGDIASCIAKTSAAPLYAAFFEVWEGKSFCDDSELDFFDRTISAVEFGAEGASKIGLKLGSGVSVALGLKRLFRIAAPIFKKIKGSKLGDMAEIVVAVASTMKDVKLTEVFPRIKLILNSSRKLPFRSVSNIKQLATIFQKKKIELFGGKNGLIEDAVNLDIIAEKGIKTDLLKDKLSFIPDGTVKEVVTFNPFIPPNAGGKGINDYLESAARITEKNGKIVISGTANNKFTRINSNVDLDALGLEIDVYRGPLLNKFETFKFYLTDGTVIDNEKMLTTILRKK